MVVTADSGSRGAGTLADTQTHDGAGLGLGSRLRVLYVTAGLPLCRGETFIIPEVHELLRCGHDVLVAPVRPYSGVIHDDALDLLPISRAERLLSLRVVWTAACQMVRHPLRTLSAAMRLLGSRSLTVLLKNLAVFPKGLWLARLATRERVDHIHAHWASTSATAAWIAAQVANVPWSFTAHRWDITENNLVGAKARSASFVRAISARGRDELQGLVGHAASKLRLIHMGVSLPADFSMPAVATPPVFRVLMAAFFVEVKGHRFALDAVASLRDRGVPFRLDLAGVGPVLEEIRQHASHLRLPDDRVRFLGMLSHEHILRGFAERAWDVALLPSITASDGAEEGIPVFLMEAMASGIPVVSTATGGIAELVEGAGLLVPQRDGQAIAEAIERLFRDPKLREDLAARGRERVARHFAGPVVMAQMIELFREARRGSPIDLTS